MTQQQQPSLLFYQRVVALDRHLHAGLKIKPAADLAFTARSPIVPLLSTEFIDAAREYPIVFLRDAQLGLVPVVLTGVPDGKNVYVDEAGRWNARYVPAYVRRHPFVFAQTAPDQFTVCIDADCPAFGESEGAALFEAGGESSPTLQLVVSRLSEYQRQSQITVAFMQRLEASGMLVEADAKADLQNGQSFALRGFWIVDETRFRALPEIALKEWFASGELGLIYAHLLSLGNLIELLRRRPAAVSEAAAAQSSEPSVRESTPSLATH